MNTSISVIIPIYNCESTLAKLLDSILLGTVVPSEIILVDDGSDDASLSVANKYALDNARIQTFSIPHSGVSTARNLGLSKATGSWISFLDADDYIEPDMYALMLEAIQTSGQDSDGCICGYYTHKDGISMPYTLPSPDPMSSETILKSMFADDSVRGFLFTRLFRSELVKELSFDSHILLCEDLLFQTQLFTSKDVLFTCVSKPLYHYVQNESSATSRQSFFAGEDFIYKPAFDKIKKLYNTPYVSRSYNDIMNFCMYTLLKNYHKAKSLKTRNEIRLLQNEMKLQPSSSYKMTTRRFFYEKAPILYSHILQ